MLKNYMESYVRIGGRGLKKSYVRLHGGRLTDHGLWVPTRPEDDEFLRIVKLSYKSSRSTLIHKNLVSDFSLIKEVHVL